MELTCSFPSSSGDDRVSCSTTNILYKTRKYPPGSPLKKPKQPSKPQQADTMKPVRGKQKRYARNVTDLEEVVVPASHPGPQDATAERRRHHHSRPRCRKRSQPSRQQLPASQGRG